MANDSVDWYEQLILHEQTILPYFSDNKQCVHKECIGKSPTQNKGGKSMLNFLGNLN